MPIQNQYSFWYIKRNTGNKAVRAAVALLAAALLWMLTEGPLLLFVGELREEHQGAGRVQDRKAPCFRGRSSMERERAEVCVLKGARLLARVQPPRASERSAQHHGLPSLQDGHQAHVGGASQAKGGRSCVVAPTESFA